MASLMQRWRGRIKSWTSWRWTDSLTTFSYGQGGQLLLSTGECVVYVNMEDKIFSFEGELVLLVDVEEEDILYNSSLVAHPC